MKTGIKYTILSLSTGTIYKNQLINFYIEDNIGEIEIKSITGKKEILATYNDIKNIETLERLFFEDFQIVKDY